MHSGSRRTSRSAAPRRPGGLGHTTCCRRTSPGEGFHLVRRRRWRVPGARCLGGSGLSSARRGRGPHREAALPYKAEECERGGAGGEGGARRPARPYLASACRSGRPGAPGPALRHRCLRVGRGSRVRGPRFSSHLPRCSARRWEDRLPHQAKSQNQIVGLDNKHLYPLGHPASPGSKDFGESTQKEMSLSNMGIVDVGGAETKCLLSGHSDLSVWPKTYRPFVFDSAFAMVLHASG
ncbi:uncharacterized protein LOC115071658 [Nannospalax galili]|uniref:uncharacterized protein LOC115071658 n=1 Tax=Nannospalax galili TaxID=1026970 RepID=UPI00111C7F81|nr:uncharacterized protein LOC115071658 [Nannospalax galili]